MFVCVIRLCWCRTPSTRPTSDKLLLNGYQTPPNWLPSACQSTSSTRSVLADILNIPTQTPSGRRKAKMVSAARVLTSIEARRILDEKEQKKKEEQQENECKKRKRGNRGNYRNKRRKSVLQRKQKSRTRRRRRKEVVSAVVRLVGVSIRVAQVQLLSPKRKPKMTLNFRPENFHQMSVRFALACMMKTWT